MRIGTRNNAVGTPASVKVPVGENRLGSHDSTQITAGPADFVP